MRHGAQGDPRADRHHHAGADRGLPVWFLDRTTLTRAFELMELYADHPMDLADASLVTAAETLGTRRVFTIDRNDFETYRVRCGHRHHAIQIVS